MLRPPVLLPPPDLATVIDRAATRQARLVVTLRRTVLALHASNGGGGHVGVWPVCPHVLCKQAYAAVEDR